MKVTLDIEDSKSETFIAFLRLLDFVTILPDDPKTDKSDWMDIE